MKRLPKIPLFFSLLFTVYSLPFTLLASPVWAQGVCFDRGSDATISCLGDFVQRAINFIFPLAGAVALIFLLWGGVRFITSGGDPKSVESAKKTMTYALLGLAVIFSIFAIFKVIQIATGVDILSKFQIVQP